MFGCPFRPLNFECLNVERSFLVCGISRSSSYIKVMGSRSRSQEKVILFAVVCFWLNERQCSFGNDFHYRHFLLMQQMKEVNYLLG